MKRNSSFSRSRFKWAALVQLAACSVSKPTGAPVEETDKATQDASVSDDAGHTSAGPMLGPMPNPALIVANGGSGSIAIVDPVTLKLVNTIGVQVGLHPHHIGISPDKSQLLITATSIDMSGGHGAAVHGAESDGEHAAAGHAGASGTTLVYCLDVAAQKLREVISVNATAHNALFTRDGSMIVLSMMEHGMISGYSAVTFEEVFSSFGFEMPLEVTPTGVDSLLVAESGAGRVAHFDLVSRTIREYFNTGATPVAAWASGGPTGTDYFVAAEDGKVLSHLAEGGGTITADGHMVELGGMPGQAMLTPDGADLWVALEDTGVVAILDAATHERIGEIPVGTKPHGIAFDPDGTRAFVTDETGGKVMVIDVTAREVETELVLDGKPNGIVWLVR